MAGLMTAPMMIIELVLMGSMHESKRMNAVIVAVSTGALILFWVRIRWHDRDLGQAVPSIDDPASRWSDSDVREGPHS